MDEYSSGHHIDCAERIVIQVHSRDSSFTARGGPKINRSRARRRAGQEKRSRGIGESWAEKDVVGGRELADIVVVHHIANPRVPNLSSTGKLKDLHKSLTSDDHLVILNSGFYVSTIETGLFDFFRRKNETQEHSDLSALASRTQCVRALFVKHI